LSTPQHLRWGDIGRWLPGLVISSIAIVLLIRLANWQEVGEALAAIDLSWLLPALFFYLVGISFRTLSWMTLLQKKAQYSRVFLTLNQGYLLNNIFPFRLGELGRMVLLAQATGISAFFVLSTIVIERAYDLAIAAGLLLATIPFVLELASAQPIARIVLGLVGLGLLALFMLARYRGWVKARLESVTAEKTFIREKVFPRLMALLDGLTVLAQPGLFLLSVLFMGCNWLFGVIEFHVLLNSAGIQAPFWCSGFVLGVVSLGIALPSAPAGIGVYEVAMVGALSLLGVSAAQALAVAIVAHLIHIGVTGAIGAYAFFRDGETLAGLYQRLRGAR
jgi:uncharacterized protein (TIRG00374 family)